MNVDDYFPTKNNGRELIGATSENGTIWHIVLEKAYAKYYGSFADIIGGNPCDGFRDLTGYPSYSYKNKDTDDAWEKINEGN
ncbi:MAG: C2 family cysteine protease [bacterium]